jgi:acyl carrier protein
MSVPRVAGPAPAHDPEVVERTCAIVAEALGRRREEVRVDSCLMEELGAESLDFLDIVFRLEESFGITISRGEIERGARGEMSDEEFAPGGVISERGLERLRLLLPEAAPRIAPGLRARQILGLFTVETFVKIVEGKRAGQSLVVSPDTRTPSAQGSS